MKNRRRFVPTIDRLETREAPSAIADVPLPDEDPFAPPPTIPPYTPPVPPGGPGTPK